MATVSADISDGDPARRSPAAGGGAGWDSHADEGEFTFGELVAATVQGVELQMPGTRLIS